VVIYREVVWTQRISPRGLVEVGACRESEDRGSKGHMHFGIRKLETPMKGEIEGCGLMSIVGWTMA
jgi:hypothetical protein